MANYYLIELMKEAAKILQEMKEQKLGYKVESKEGYIENWSNVQSKYVFAGHPDDALIFGSLGAAKDAADMVGGYVLTEDNKEVTEDEPKSKHKEVEEDAVYLIELPNGYFSSEEEHLGGFTAETANSHVEASFFTARAMAEKIASTHGGVVIKRVGEKLSEVEPYSPPSTKPLEIKLNTEELKKFAHKLEEVIVQEVAKLNKENVNMSSVAVTELKPGKMRRFSGASVFGLTWTLFLGALVGAHLDYTKVQSSYNQGVAAGKSVYTYVNSTWHNKCCCPCCKCEDCQCGKCGADCKGKCGDKCCK
jgi:hypothetical protein